MDDGKRPIRLAWHVLPRKAARLVMDGESQYANNALLSAVTPLNSVERSPSNPSALKNTGSTPARPQPILARKAFYDVVIVGY